MSCENEAEIFKQEQQTYWGKARARWDSSAAGGAQAGAARTAAAVAAVVVVVVVALWGAAAPTRGNHTE